MPSTKLVANRWVRNYARAWREKDAKAIASLFAEDATYHSHPFRPGHQGRKGVLEYTLGALDVQEVYEVRFGKPVVEGSRAAVEYWTTMERKDGRRKPRRLRNAPLCKEWTVQGTT